MKIERHIRRFFCRKNGLGHVRDGPACTYCLKYNICYPDNLSEDEIIEELMEDDEFMENF